MTLGFTQLTLSYFGSGLGYLYIHTQCDLSDLSNMIGSLSRTIQQYSPPSEWIMCKLGVLPIFF